MSGGSDSLSVRSARTAWRDEPSVAARTAWLAILLVFASTCLVSTIAYLLSLLLLVTTPGDVLLGFAEAVVTDAAAWRFAGQPLYGTLTDGAAGLPYTPGLPLLVGLLMGTLPWNGWPLLITMLATLALGGFSPALSAVVVARRRAGQGNLLFALAASCFHIPWLLLVLPLSLLHEGRADLPALLLGMAALWGLDLARGGRMRMEHRSRIGIAGLAGALAILAFAFKQTAAVVAIAALVGLSCAELHRRWRLARSRPAEGSGDRRQGTGARRRAPGPRDLGFGPATPFGGVETRSAFGLRAGRTIPLLAAFFTLFGIGLMLLVAAIASNAGAQGLRAVFGDGMAFDRSLPWSRAAGMFTIGFGPALLAWGLAHLFGAGMRSSSAPAGMPEARASGHPGVQGRTTPAVRGQGAMALSAAEREETALSCAGKQTMDPASARCWSCQYALLPASALVGIALFRYDGADWNAFLFFAIALGWTALLAIRRLVLQGRERRAAFAMALLGSAALLTPAWQRATLSGETAGVARTVPGGTASAFGVVRHPRRASLREMRGAAILARICGPGADAPGAESYDPRLPYREAFRTGRTRPGVLGLADHYAIGRGPATSLIEALETGRFACVIEGELLASPVWLDYVGPAPDRDPRRDFDALRRALESGYEPTDRQFEGRSIWRPRALSPPRSSRRPAPRSAPP